MQKHVTGHVMGTSELLATNVAWIFVLFSQRPAILFSILKLSENIMQLSKSQRQKVDSAEKKLQQPSFVELRNGDLPPFLCLPFSRTFFKS